MTDVSIQRSGELLRKLFEILFLHSEGMRAGDALAELRNSVKLTDYEKGEYASGGGTRFEKIVRFATVDLVKAGWMIKDKGIWFVTDEGKRAYHEHKSPDDFYRTAQKLYREWKRSQPKQKVKGEEVVTTVKKATITFEEATEQAWGEIEEYLRKMPPYEFQKVVADLLKAMGYHVSWIAPPGKDGGVDVLAWNDPLGTRPPRIKVQVKREINNKIDVAVLRSFMALLGENDVGIFVSASGFTRAAEDEARTQQSRQVTLIDLGRLYELWIEHLDKLDEEARDLFPLKPIYFLAPNG